MLEGITVLNTSAAVDFNAAIFFISFIIVLIVGAIISALLDAESLFYVLLFVGALFICTPLAYGESEDRLRYECTIDESVSMIEVYERYEIIEQRGDIWILEDKK